MPATKSRSSAERTRARRRARLAARGEEVVVAETAPAEAAPTHAGGLPAFLGRLFPPAPPLPGKGDPLGGFTYTGRYRGVVSGAWLLARHPLPWGAAGAGWAVLQLLLLLTARENLAAFAITLGQYGLLIGAGWIGWWRPWLFGTAAGVFGVILQAVIAGLVTLQSGEDFSAAMAVIGSLTALLVLYGLVGAFAGFYGGYLRRRMAIQPQKTSKARRR
jgi:hypothetical protein